MITLVRTNPSIDSHTMWYQDKYTFVRFAQPEESPLSSDVEFWDIFAMVLDESNKKRIIHASGLAGRGADAAVYGMLLASELRARGGLAVRSVHRDPFVYDGYWGHL